MGYLNPLPYCFPKLSLIGSCLHHAVKARCYTPKGETWSKNLVKRLSNILPKPLTGCWTAHIHQVRWQAPSLALSPAVSHHSKWVGNSDGCHVQRLFPFIPKYKCWRSCCSLHFEVSYNQLLLVGTGLLTEKSHLIPRDRKSWHLLHLRQMLTKRTYQRESFSPQQDGQIFSISVNDILKLLSS